MSRSASRWVKSHSPCSGQMLCQRSSSANRLVKLHYPYSDWMLPQMSSSASRLVKWDYLCFGWMLCQMSSSASRLVDSHFECPQLLLTAALCIVGLFTTHYVQTEQCLSTCDTVLTFQVTWNSHWSIITNLTVIPCFYLLLYANSTNVFHVKHISQHSTYMLIWQTTWLLSCR